MEIQLNGETRQFDEGTTISKVLEVIQMKSRLYAVEVNRQIIPKKEHTTYVLQPGDEVEVVHPVGGG